MTHRISRTLLEAQNLGDFAGMAAAHAVEMRDWRAHMARVAEDEKNGVTGIERHMAHPRPVAHPLIDAAVNENCEMDYEIVDDGPSPEQILRAQKNHLLNQVALAEQQALDDIAPVAKRRLLNLRENDIAKAHSDRINEIGRQKAKTWDDWGQRQNKKGLLKKVGDAIGITKPEPPPEDVDVHAEAEKLRPAEDAKHLEEQASRRERAEAIARMAAQAFSDIEDLTIDNVASWSAPDFTRKD